MKNKKQNLAQLFNELLEQAGVDKELITGEPIIAMVGNHTVSIENFERILEYSDENIKLKTKNGDLIINGKNLQAKSMTNEAMKIKGSIQCIAFEV